MTNEFLYDVFLSHNSRDKPRVRKLAERLKNAGLLVWFDEWNTRKGNILAEKVYDGLRHSRVLVLCVSRNALASDWVTLERTTAIHRDPANERRRFIPLLLESCELPDTLKLYKYVDFHAEDDAAFAELVTACSIGSDGTPPIQLQQPPSKSDLNVTLKYKLESGGYIYRIAWHPSGHQIAAACEDGAVRLWDPTTGELQFTLTAYSWRRRTFAVAYAPYGEMLASAGEGGEILLWRTANGKNIYRLEGHHKDIWDLAFSPDGTLLSSASDDGSVGIWNTKTWQNESLLYGGDVEQWGLRFSRSGKILVSGTTEGNIHVWDVARRGLIKKLSGHDRPVFTVAFSPDDKLFATSSVDCSVRVWDVNTLKLVTTLESHRGSVEAVDFSSDGTFLATKSLDGTVLVWFCHDWNIARTLEVPVDSHWHPGLAFHPSQPILATLGSFDQELHLWQFKNSTAKNVETHLRKYASAKIVLLGESGVGKTTLAHRLVEDRYIRTDSTHGMNVWRLDLPHNNEKDMAYEVWLWDLAGQMGYREIHQLFLDQTALALLLLNPQKDEPFAGAADWLNAIRAAKQDRSDDVVKLLITTRHDVGGSTVGDQKIHRFLRDNGFDGWIRTSAKSGENCSDKKNGGRPSELKQLIARSIPWEKLPCTSTPRLLAELKNALMAMRAMQDIRLLRFAELAQRLEQALPEQRFGESEIRTAVTLLANHGLARPLKFGDLVLLQPELLNGYAASIIRAARAHTDEIGCVLESDIYKSDFDFTGVERLHNRPDEELLLRALVQTFLDHSLCIAEETTQGRQLVFPSQYRREKDIPRDPDIFVSYTFSGESQTVWTTLVVRLWYSQEFEHRELWRNAAEFASPKNYILGLKIDNKQGEGTATISLYFDKEVHDELKSIFIEYVHRHLAKFGYEVTRDRRYACSQCGKAVKDLDAVRKRLEAKKDFIICQECDKKVLLIDFIEQRLKSDPVARKILAMDEIATRQLDTQALEQILIGHMMAITGEANQIFRELDKFDYGIDGEVEFKDNDGRASGKKIYIQLKSGNSYLRTRKHDGSEVFDVSNERHLEYWISQPVDVYLVIRQTDEMTGVPTIRWMNVTRYLNNRKDKKSRQIIFQGEKLDMDAVWRVRDQCFPPETKRC
jgi:small GTP-binding protein